MSIPPIRGIRRSTRATRGRRRPIRSSAWSPSAARPRMRTPPRSRYAQTASSTAGWSSATTAVRSPVSGITDSGDAAATDLGIPNSNAPDHLSRVSFAAIDRGYNRALFDVLPVPIVVALDESGLVAGANEAFLQLVGLERDEVIGAAQPYPWRTDVGEPPAPVGQTIER